GNVKIPPDLTMPATVRYFPIGERKDNVAVSAMALQPSPAGQTLFAQATNYGGDVAERRLDVYLDGSLFSAYNMRLDPGRDQSVVVEVPPQVRVAEARLVDDSGRDALPADNSGWAVSTLGEGTTIRVVSGGNRFLETALKLLPGIKTTLTPTSTA